MRQLPLLTLILFTLAVYFTACFGSGLLDDADSGHAEISKEILQRDDWVTLHMNGIRFLEKGPLLFWMGAISFQYLGVNELGTRAVEVLCILATVLLCCALGTTLSGRRAGFYSGLIFAASWGVFLFTRIFIPDILITFTIGLAMYAYWRSRKSLLFAYLFWAALAGAVLAKGLIGIVFPLAAVGLYILLTWRWNDVRTLRPGPGTLFFLLLAAPWHILASLRTPKFAWFYFVNEHFLRFLGKRLPMDYDKVPLVPFWTLLLLWLFPFSVFLPLVFRRSPKPAPPAAPAVGSAVPAPAPSRRSAPPDSPAPPRKILSNLLFNGADNPRLFLWLWAAVVMLFFSFSTRQEYYTMPAWPPLVVLIGLALDRAETEQSRWLAWLQGIPALLGLLAGGTLAGLLWISRNVRVQGDIASLLTSNPDMYKLSLGHMFDLQPSTFAALRLPAACAAVVLAFGFLYALRLRLGGRHVEATLATAATAGLFLLCAHLAFLAFEPYLSSRPLARAIERVLKPEDAVVINGEYYNASSLGFYLPPKMYLLNGRMTGLEFGSHYPDAPPLFIGDSDIAKWWSGSRRIFLFTEGGETRAAVEKLLPAGSVQVIASSGGKFVLSNRR